MVIQGVRYPSDFEAKKQMIEAGTFMCAKDYTIFGCGSLSARVGPNAVWISKEGEDLGSLKQDSFVRVNLNGKNPMGMMRDEPSSLLDIHLGIYNTAEKIRFVIHSHPMGAVLMGLKGCHIESSDIIPALKSLGHIDLCKGDSKEDILSGVKRVCLNEHGIIVPHDGCFIWGESLREVLSYLTRMDYYEKLMRLMGCCREKKGCGDFSIKSNSTDLKSDIDKKDTGRMSEDQLKKISELVITKLSQKSAESKIKGDIKKPYRKIKEDNGKTFSLEKSDKEIISKTPSSAKKDYTKNTDANPQSKIKDGVTREVIEHVYASLK